MKLRLKILLLAVVPLLIAMAALSFAVYQQGISLVRQEKQVVSSAWLQSKEAELRHYVKLGYSAIKPLLADTDVDGAQQQALDLLGQMEFDRDGYFFVYDLNGRSLMHPRQPDLVGKDLSGMRDEHGDLVVQRLLAAARAAGTEGQVIHYLWQKPSAQRETEKLGYVMVVPEWNWMLGTGIYNDDIEAALNDIDAAAQQNIRGMLAWVAGIAAISTLLVAGSGLALNISDHRQSDAKLRVLARQVVQSQEDERARLSRELHDGISQHLVSTKLVLEAAHERLLRQSPRPDSAASPPGRPPVEDLLANALERLHATVGEVRRISHNLRPSLLDDLGLPTALAQLAREITAASGSAGAPLHSDVHVHGEVTPLPESHNTALFRIAQEALTNVIRHARAARIDMTLTYAADHVRLDIQDDGCGFDYADVQRDPDRGIGLRNMRERVAPLGGRMTLQTGLRGTALSASLPTAGATAT